MNTDLQAWLKPARKELRKRGKAASKAARDVRGRAEHLAERMGEDRSWTRYAGVAALGFAAGAAALSARKIGMQATTAVAGDWLKQLKAEHRMVEKLFDAVNATEAHETGRRTALLAHIAYALLKHGLQEETVIYPALRDGHHGDAPHEQSAKSLAAEHFDIKTYLHELAETPKDDPKWMATMQELQALIAHHVREEEEEVYPPFHARLSDAENRKLTLAMNREGIKIA